MDMIELRKNPVADDYPAESIDAIFAAAETVLEAFDWTDTVEGTTYWEDVRSNLLRIAKRARENREKLQGQGLHTKL